MPIWFTLIWVKKYKLIHMFICIEYTPRKCVRNHSQWFPSDRGPGSLSRKGDLHSTFLYSQIFFVSVNY